MKRLFAFLFLPVFIAACQSVPITGRSRLSLVSDSQVTQLSNKNYKKLINFMP